MRLRYVALVLATYACGANGDRKIAGPVSERTWADAPPSTEDRATASYADAVQKSSHNSYAREEPLLDQLLYHRIRSVEVDIHRSREGVKAKRGEWFVYHEDLPLMRTTSCVMLADCVRQLAAFHAAIPRH